MIIKIKLAVTKVDKSKLFTGKNGAKYLDVTLLENRDGPDQYGNDFMCVQDVSKEERESGKRGAILGNGKIMGQKPPAPKAASPKTDDDSSLVPF